MAVLKGNCVKFGFAVLDAVARFLQSAVSELHNCNSDNLIVVIRTHSCV